MRDVVLRGAKWDYVSPADAMPDDGNLAVAEKTLAAAEEETCGLTLL